MAQGVGGTLTREHVVSGAALGFVVLVVVVPLVGVASQIDAVGTRVLWHARPWQLLGRSLLLASAVTAGAVAIGVPTGAIFARGRVPLRAAAFVVHLFPVFLPPFFSALGWFHLLGGGFVSGPTGAWAVLTLALAPIVSALTALGVGSLDPSLEEAGRLVASPSRVLFRILVPAALPHVALGALLVFSLSLAELAVPMFSRVDVYSAAVFARLGAVQFAPGEAAALSVPALAVALPLAWAERRVRLSLTGGALRLRAPARDPIELGRVAALVPVAAAVASAAPAAVLAAHGAPAFPSLTGWLGSSAETSVALALSTAAIATLFGVVLGHGLARRRPRAALADGILLGAFFAPAAVLGTGVVVAWNRPATQWVYGSASILCLGFLGRYAVLASRTIAASIATASESHEAAAAAAGAGYLRRLLRIVAPMHRRAVLGAFGLTAIFCLRDLDTAVLFYPPGREPLTVRIFTLEANGPTRVVAALATTHAAITAAALGVLLLLLRRSRA